MQLFIVWDKGKILSTLLFIEISDCIVAFSVTWQHKYVMKMFDTSSQVIKDVINELIFIEFRFNRQEWSRGFQYGVT